MPGRPTFESGHYTERKGDVVVHYTCNAPSADICRKNKIELVGEAYELTSREALLIPIKLIRKKLGKETESPAEIEALLAKLR